MLEKEDFHLTQVKHFPNQSSITDIYTGLPGEETLSPVVIRMRVWRDYHGIFILLRVYTSFIVRAVNLLY